MWKTGLNCDVYLSVYKAYSNYVQSQMQGTEYNTITDGAPLGSVYLSQSKQTVYDIVHGLLSANSPAANMYGLPGLFHDLTNECILVEKISKSGLLCVDYSIRQSIGIINRYSVSSWEGVSSESSGDPWLQWAQLYSFGKADSRKPFKLADLPEVTGDNVVQFGITGARETDSPVSSNGRTNVIWDMGLLAYNQNRNLFGLRALAGQTLAPMNSARGTINWTISATGDNVTIQNSVFCFVSQGDTIYVKSDSTLKTSRYYGLYTRPIMFQQDACIGYGIQFNSLYVY